jgi:hypothetical protein
MKRIREITDNMAARIKAPMNEPKQENVIKCISLGRVEKYVGLSKEYI